MECIIRGHKKLPRPCMPSTLWPMLLVRPLAWSTRASACTRSSSSPTRRTLISPRQPTNGPPTSPRNIIVHVMWRPRAASRRRLRCRPPCVNVICNVSRRHRPRISAPRLPPPTWSSPSDSAARARIARPSPTSRTRFARPLLITHNLFSSSNVFKHDIFYFALFNAVEPRLALQRRVFDQQ